MRNHRLNALGGLLVSAGLALGQSPSSPTQDAVARPPLVPALEAGPPVAGFPPLAGGEGIPPAGDGGDLDAGLFWVRGEYLLWWVADGRLPVTLLRKGDINDNLSPQKPLPVTPWLLGNSGLEYGPLSGGRLAACVWLDDGHRLGIEGSGFSLEEATVTEEVRSDGTGSPALFRPLFNVFFGNTSFVGVPLTTPGEGGRGLVTGGMTQTSSSRLWGADVGLAAGDVCRCFPLVLFAGFRYLDLGEGLDVLARQEDVDGVLAFSGRAHELPGSTVTVLDRFRTTNHFFGGQVGARAECGWGAWEVGLAGKLALGLNRQAVEIAGASTQEQPGRAPVTVPGGFLAVRSNSGRFTRDEFSAVPEVSVRLSYRLAAGLRPFVGYDFLYWSNVARPGEQVYQPIDQRQVPTSPFFDPAAPANQPVVPFKHAWDFWAQGLTVGLSLCY